MKHPHSTLSVSAVFRYITASMWILLAGYASAHQTSTGYLNLDTKDMQINKGQIQLRWSDLETSLALGDNTVKQLLLAEIQSQQTAVVSYLKKHMHFMVEQSPCIITFTTPLQVSEHFDEHYMVANFNWSCPIESEQLTINYSAIFQQDNAHSLLINVEDNNSSVSGVIKKEDESFVVDFTQASQWETFTLYVYQGVLHIFMGIDHILFLIALLLTCALSREEQHWKQATNNKSVYKNAAWIVTAFTLAHSLTLTATAMELIVPNSRWVELGIAISVLLTALNNIWPVIIRLGWITFAFGLLHGMGFAGVLGELGLARDQKLLSILSFNLGVEVGQLMILIIVLPLLILASKRNWYQQYGVKIGSAMIALIALSWSVQRF